MERAKLKGILREIGLSSGKNRGEFKDSGSNLQFCCPFHGETRPSCGIHVDDLIGRCFACGETFTLSKLVAHQLGYNQSFKSRDGQVHESYNYKKADEWLEEKFNIEKRAIVRENLRLIRIEDTEEEEDKPTRYEMPKIKLAPLRSGKSIHSYFFERGFTKETAKKFMVGWDAIRNRITVPVFWEDGVLCGIIGRAVIEMKLPDGSRNPEFNKVYKEKERNDVKYYIYDTFPVGDILFPLPHFKVIDDMAILVEGQYDCMWLHQNGFTNALSSLGSKLTYDRRTETCKQRDILLKLGVKKILLMRDPDKAGREGSEHDYKILKDDFIVYTADYPEGKSDPQELTKEEIQEMIDNKYVYGKKSRKLKRIE